MTQDKANELMQMIVDAFEHVENSEATQLGALMLKLGALIQAQVQD